MKSKTVCLKSVGWSLLAMLGMVLGIASAQAADLEISFTKMESDQGPLRYAVFVDAGAAGFPDQQEKAFAVGELVIKNGQASVVIKDLPAGKVAVTAFRDGNNNGKLDTNFLGIPSEQYGFSNNVRPRRKARFDEAALNVTEGQTLKTEIRVVYFYQR